MSMKLSKIAPVFLMGGILCFSLCKTENHARRTVSGFLTWFRVSQYYILRAGKARIGIGQIKRCKYAADKPHARTHARTHAQGFCAMLFFLSSVFAIFSYFAVSRLFPIASLFQYRLFHIKINGFCTKVPNSARKLIFGMKTDTYFFFWHCYCAHKSV